MKSWIVKYDVPQDKQALYQKKWLPLLVDVFSSVPQGERPGWMDDLNLDDSDSYGYALRFAEESFKNTVAVSNNLKSIQDHLLSSTADPQAFSHALSGMSHLASDLSKKLSSLNHRFGELKKNRP